MWGEAKHRSFSHIFHTALTQTWLKKMSLKRSPNSNAVDPDRLKQREREHQIEPEGIEKTLTH